MGGKGSKEPEPAPVVEVDERWDLSRGFGPKYDEFFAKLREHKDANLDRTIPRPVHVSNLNRLWPIQQAWYYHVGLIALVFRKMPFTNPFMRVYMVVLGVDLCRGRLRYSGVIEDRDMKEIRTFDRMWWHLRNRVTLRMPDFHQEYEDWYDLNKPAYRVPITHENSFDSWMRYFAINRHLYRLRPVQWNGDFEQEMCLNMDLSAPHTDHWLNIH